MKPSLDAHSNYISTRFSSTHDPGDIGDLYKRYRPFAKYNFIRHFPQSKDLRIVDIGCGFGQMLHALKHYGYDNVTGVDLSPECVDFCKNKGFRATPGDLATFFDTERERY